MNNGQKVKIGLTIGILFFSVAAGYTEVKIRSINNEKNIMKTDKNIEDIKIDIRNLLVKQERVLIILEGDKESK